MNPNPLRDMPHALWVLICRTSTGIALGAISAGLFGAAIAGLGIGLGWRLEGVLPFAGYFAACGAVSGILVGMLCAIVEAGQGNSAGTFSDDCEFGRSRPLVNPLVSRWNMRESVAMERAAIQFDQSRTEGSGSQRSTIGAQSNRYVKRFEMPLRKLTPASFRRSQVTSVTDDEPND